MLDICIIAHFAYGSMTGGATGHSGGVERQVSIMSQWLANKGHNVSLVTWDEGQPHDTYINGVRVIKMCRQSDGVPGLRFIHPRWSSLYKALNKANAQLYYHNCAEYVTGQIALWCKLKSKKFVYSVASDIECDPKLPELRTVRDRVLYRYGLRQADTVIVQTNAQKRMLKAGFGLTSHVFPMPCHGPTKSEFHPPQPSKPSSLHVAWVGRITPEKRLDVLLDIAEQLPDVHFHVAGKPDRYDIYSKSILSRALAMPNVHPYGRLSRDEITKLYSNVSMLVNTSRYEGFPNTFLEAWSYGLPVLSCIDPDGIINNLKLGIVSDRTAELAQAISMLGQTPDLWVKYSRNARAYYSSNHSIDSAMARFENLFISITPT